MQNTSAFGFECNLLILMVHVYGTIKKGIVLLGKCFENELFLSCIVFLPIILFLLFLRCRVCMSCIIRNIRKYVKAQPVREWWYGE